MNEFDNEVVSRIEGYGMNDELSRANVNFYG